MKQYRTMIWAPLAVMLSVLPVYADDLPNPEEMGPYPVGVTTVLLEDHSRIDALTKGPRPLMTEIWYPATDDTRGMPKNKMSDFYLKGTHQGLATALKMAFKVDLMELDKTFENESVRDARVRDGVFPLVLFSHGNGGMRMQNAFWCDHIASHGYIVVAPDHTGNASVTTIDGKLIPMNPAQREASSADRPKDMSFLIDVMTRWNAGADSRFLGKFDIEHIAMSGHSFGGYTSTKVADVDPRVDCIIPMAAVGIGRVNYAVPALIIIATEDDTIGVAGNAKMREYYEQSTGPRVLLEFKNAGHFSFTEMFQFIPDFGDGVGKGKRTSNGEEISYVPKKTVYRYTNGFSTAFLGKYLKGMDGYDGYLAKNPDPSELIHDAKLP